MVESVSGSSSSAPLRIAALRMAWSQRGAVEPARGRRGAARTAAGASGTAAIASACCANCVAAGVSSPSAVRASARNRRSASDCAPSASQTHTAIS